MLARVSSGARIPTPLCSQNVLCQEVKHKNNKKYQNVWPAAIKKRMTSERADETALPFTNININVNKHLEQNQTKRMLQKIQEGKLLIYHSQMRK